MGHSWQQLKGIFVKQMTVNIKGLSPLLMHSDRFANPLDPATKAHKELTSKRTKTDVDHEDIAKSEWLGSMYYSQEIGPFMPGQNFDASIRDAAKFQKLGKKFGQALMVIEDEIPIKYKGPRDLDGLFAAKYFDIRGVKVGQARLMRCRPKFNDWACQFSLVYNEDVLNTNQVLKAIQDAGKLIGVGDYRPGTGTGGRFGKFSAEVQ